MADSAIVETSRRGLSRLPGGPCPQGHNCGRQRGCFAASPSLCQHLKAGRSCGICSREELAGITVHRQALHHHSRPYSVPSTWSCWVYQSGGAEFPAPLLWLWVHEEPKGQRNVSQEDKAYFKERGKENAPRSRLHLAFVLVVTWRKAESQPPRRLLSSETELGDVNRGEYAPHSGLWVHAGTP